MMTVLQSKQRMATAAGILLLAAGMAVAQGGKKGKPLTPSQIKSMDAEAARLQQSFLGGMEDLARSYEDAGQLDRAKRAFEEILKIDPENEEAAKHLKQFEEAVFDANAQNVEVDASYGWTATGLAVAKDKPIRFEASGTYKFVVNEAVGPDGFSTEDVVRDMANAPVGALVGVVMPPQTAPGERAEERNAGKPFLIGSQSEFKPKEDGFLFVKLNVPPASKCAGKVKVTVSGNIQRAR